MPPMPLLTRRQLTLLIILTIVLTAVALKLQGVKAIAETH